MALTFHYNIVMIGAGNVAWHMAPALADAGHHVMQIYSRSHENAKTLARIIGAEAISDYDKIDPTAHIYIYALKDDALQWIATKIKTDKGLHVHTSGSMAMDIFSPIRNNYGCLYPLQTFSKGKKIDWRKVPIFIEANTEDNLKILRDLTTGLSRKIYELSSNDRRSLHLAGVFASNFTNLMYCKAEEILKEKGIPFSVMHGLITEAVNKAKLIGPRQSQTGPASRKDFEIMKRQTMMLGEDGHWSEIYRLLSEEIMNRTNETE